MAEATSNFIWLPAEASRERMQKRIACMLQTKEGDTAKVIPQAIPQRMMAVISGRRRRGGDPG